MGAHHSACKFSATVMTTDVAVLHMLRALCQHCESGKYKQIAWGGTGARLAKERERGDLPVHPTSRSSFLPQGGTTAVARILAPGQDQQPRSSHAAAIGVRLGSAAVLRRIEQS
jgi:hypothetical protein